MVRQGRPRDLHGRLDLADGDLLAGADQEEEHLEACQVSQGLERLDVALVGVQLETVDAVMSQLALVKSAGLPVREEMGVNCCHANQDKFWVQDPDGVEWEVYHLNYDLEDDVAKPAKGLQMAKSSTCCAS